MENSKYIKYPRTYHLPWSNSTSDDKILHDDSNFHGKFVVCTLKMDGENCTMYNDHIHARSLESSSHSSRSWVKGLWSKISYKIDDKMRICGENLYAVHSIKYNDLPSYFMVFSIWIDEKCLSWKDTIEYIQLLELESVPVFYEGLYDREKIEKAFQACLTSMCTHEGYVVRLSSEFYYKDFKQSVAKYVRQEFQQIINSSEKHWSTKKVEANILNKNNL